MTRVVVRCRVCPYLHRKIKLSCAVSAYVEYFKKARLEMHTANQESRNNIRESVYTRNRERRQNKTANPLLLLHSVLVQLRPSFFQAPVLVMTPLSNQLSGRYA